MKVRIITTIPGMCDGVQLTAGSVVDINDKTATFLVERGEAEAYPPVTRTAEVAPPRNAAERTGKPTPRKRHP
jgi:hypothetical protein